MQLSKPHSGAVLGRRLPADRRRDQAAVAAVAASDAALARRRPRRLSAA